MKSLQFVKNIKPTCEPQQEWTRSSLRTIIMWQQWRKLGLDETNTSIANFSLNPIAPFCTSTFTSTFSIAFFNVHTRENQHLSLMYTRHANASNRTPSYTHVTSHVVWRVHPLGLLVPTFMATEALLVVWHGPRCMMHVTYYYTTPVERQPLPIPLLNTHCLFSVPSNPTVGCSRSWACMRLQFSSIRLLYSKGPVEQTVDADRVTLYPIS